MVGVDVFGNRSEAATLAFSTGSVEPPPPPDDPEPPSDVTVTSRVTELVLRFAVDPASEASYRIDLGGELLDEFTLRSYCIERFLQQLEACLAAEQINYEIEDLIQDEAYRIALRTFDADEVEVGPDTTAVRHGGRGPVRLGDGTDPARRPRRGSHASPSPPLHPPFGTRSSASGRGRASPSSPRPPKPWRPGGLIEYPIDYTDDFSTYEDWGFNRGIWRNHLAMSATAISATRRFADQFGIDFAWDDESDRRLKWTLDAVCREYDSCFPDEDDQDTRYVVYFPGGSNYRLRPMPETGQHIVDVLIDPDDISGVLNVDWTSPRYSVRARLADAAGFTGGGIVDGEFRRGWYDLRFMPNACTDRPSTTVCDEFPFRSTDQAGNLSGRLASLRPVPGPEGSIQGTDLKQFYEQCRLADGEEFLIVPIPTWIEAGGPSFAVEVNAQGTTPCLTPTVG